MASNLKCQSCGREITEEASISGGQTLCEDCYIDASHRIRVCDPWAERSKMIFRESHGLTGTDGLTDLQKEIYEFIKSKGKATREELSEKFRLMTLDPNKKSFMLFLGNNEIYLPKDVGNSLLKKYEQGHDMFTIYRTIDVYEIKPESRSEI